MPADRRESGDERAERGAPAYRPERAAVGTEAPEREAATQPQRGGSSGSPAFAELLTAALRMNELVERMQNSSRKEISDLAAVLNALVQKHGKR